MIRKLLAAAAVIAVTQGALTGGAAASGTACALSQVGIDSVLNKLPGVVQQQNGGIFQPNRMWAAVVDRQGILCAVAKVGDAWPGSRAIAIAKAESANDFSNDGLSLSTANLYAATQPGGSLYGLNNSNPFNPVFNTITTGGGVGTGVGGNPGGIITFGGGMALYFNGKVVGGLGVSGDTSCADHTIAYRMRRAAHLDTIPGGATSNGTDNIEYPPAGAQPTGFQQPHCLPTDIPPGNI